MLGKTFLLAKYIYSSIVQSVIVTENGKVRAMFKFLAVKGNFPLSFVTVATTHFDSEKVIGTGILLTSYDWKLCCLVYLKVLRSDAGERACLGESVCL